MKRGRLSAAGTLLRLERLRRNRGQKEVCHGICVVSHLSKIERGLVTPDEAILKQLFARLDVSYETDPEFLASARGLLEDYFYRLRYGLDTAEVYRKLWTHRKRLSASPFTVDFLLVCEIEACVCLERDGKDIREPEGEAESRGAEDEIALLGQLTETMDEAQYAYFCWILARRENDTTKKLSLCRRVYEGLDNTFGMLSLIDGYYAHEDYNEIHRLENRLTSMALDEGNVYALASYYFMKATAYSCVDMDEMMAVYYERTRLLLQNTGWWERFAPMLYYNMGATYVATGKYDRALDCLNRVPGEDFLLCHKKAWLHLRLGNRREAEHFLDKMKNILLSTEQTGEADALMYEELCMERQEDFTADPKYLELAEKLIRTLKKERSFGFLYQYKDVITEAYMRQRKYKKALEFQKEISSKVQKGVL